MMTKIKDLQVKSRETDIYLIKDVKNGTTSKGAPYLSLTLQDNSGMIDGKLWDVKPGQADLCRSGKFIECSFEVIQYNQNKQLHINMVMPADESTIDMSEYVMASSYSEETRRKDAEELVASIKNENYRKLVIGMMEFVGDKYYSYPAASKIHHNFLGGLSEHSLSMAKMAEEVCNHYPQLNRDLLISGALIHDVGKTAELSGPVTTEYTVKGKLEGHISIANGWMSEVAANLHMEDTEEAVLLHHMILSHHGHLEYGSPVMPMVQEAEVLSLLDNLDARLNTLKQALGDTQPGCWTNKLFALENRQFYKPESTKEQ
jgi:3'-5' exoribonuclease